MSCHVLGLTWSLWKVGTLASIWQKRCFLTIARLGTASFCIPRRYFDIGRFCVHLRSSQHSTLYRPTISADVILFVISL